MARYYILRGQDVIEEPDYDKWARWYQGSFERVRRVASTETRYGTISTTFLGMTMTLSAADAPRLFETRVEGGWLNGQRQHYATFAEAETGHQVWVARVREAERDKLPPPGFVW